HAATIGEKGRRRHDNFFPGRQAGENLAPVASRLAERDEAQPRRIFFHYVHGPDLAALENGGLGNQQRAALAGGEGGAPEHTGPQAPQVGQVDLRGEGACGGIDRGYDFGDTTGDGTVQAVDLDGDAVADPDEAQPRLFNGGLQTEVTFALEGEKGRP